MTTTVTFDFKSPDDAPLPGVQIGATLTVDPTGATILVDTATPAGSTATRTRLHTANPSGVIIKSTATANTLAVSGS